MIIGAIVSSEVTGQWVTGMTDQQYSRERVQQLKNDKSHLLCIFEKKTVKTYVVLETTQSIPRE